MQRRGRPRIAHVTGDFPDPVYPAKTPVIRSLIELTDDGFDHQVWSLNRRATALGVGRGLIDRSRFVERTPFDRGEALVYHAPGKGLGHRSFLLRLGDHIADRLAEDRPAIVMGHKLTIEGIVARRVAERLGIPYALLLQGNTDMRIIRARPDLRGVFAAILAGAARVLAFAPWTADSIGSALGIQRAIDLIPAPTDADAILAPTIGTNRIATAFHLRHARLKNLSGLVAAHRVIVGQGCTAELVVHGGGSAQDVEHCRRTGAGDPLFRLAGPFDRAMVGPLLKRATVFAMPSLAESFGLVFVEALLAGTPVIYPAGRAIDGWFPDAPFAVAVDPRSPGALAKALHRMIANEAAIKRALADWQRSPDARRFQRPAIGDAFAQGLSGAIG